MPEDPLIEMDEARRAEVTRQIVLALGEGRMSVMGEPRFLPAPAGRLWLVTFFERSEPQRPAIPEGSDRPARIARAIANMPDQAAATYTIRDLPDGEE